MTDLWLPRVFFQALNTSKLRWGAYDAPPDSLVDWGGGHPPYPSSLDADLSALVVPPPTQIPGYAYAQYCYKTVSDRQCIPPPRKLIIIGILLNEMLLSITEWCHLVTR